MAVRAYVRGLSLAPLVAHKFWRRSSEERALLLRALLAVAVVRVAIWLLPFRSVRRLLVPMVASSGAGGETTREVVDRVAGAVNAVSPYVPGASCLTQALAAQVLLAGRGEACDLRIGVSKRPLGVKAHAWLESRHGVVIGGPQPEDLVPLPAFDGRRFQLDRAGGEAR
jgi:hypothetical protein